MSATLSVTEHTVPQGQGDLYVRDYAGSGPAFVLMHGFPDNLHIYDDLIPHLVAAGRRVVAFDFLGFGSSAKPADGTYSFAQQLGDLEAVVAALQLDRIVPVAHDAAGPTAINFAIDHPDRVASLCILNSIYAEVAGARLPELIELFATKSLGALAGAFLQAPEHFAWLLNFQRAQFQDALSESHKAHYVTVLGPLIDQNFRQQPSAALAFAHMTAGLFDELKRNSARWAEMAALEIPAKIIWGSHDPYLGEVIAEDYRTHLKGATLDILPAGHWLQMDMPEQVAAIMLAGAAS